MITQVGTVQVENKPIRCAPRECPTTITAGVAGIEHAYASFGWQWIIKRAAHATVPPGVDATPLHGAIKVSIQSVHASAMSKIVWVPTDDGAWILTDLAELELRDRALVALIRARGWQIEDTDLPGGGQHVCSIRCIRPTVLEAIELESAVRARMKGATP